MFPLAARERHRFGRRQRRPYRETLQATGFYVGRIVIATAGFAPMPPFSLPGYPGGHYSDGHRMRFPRHGGIYQSDGGIFQTQNPSRTPPPADVRIRAREPGGPRSLAHRLDEFRSAIPRSGWSPPEPVSASPTRPEYFDCPIRGNELSSNGNQCLNWLSHLSGQAQPHA
jgi:hypothetical protein